MHNFDIERNYMGKKGKKKKLNESTSLPRNQS